MRQFAWFTSLALAAACSLGHAQETAGNRWPIADVAAPTTELALELYVAIAPRVEVGESDDGVRQFIPITGGRFSGDGIRGEVMPGGADWQLRRRDGVVEVNALYSIRTDDGAVIVVDNRGIIVPPPPAAGGGAAAPAAAYVRTSPRAIRVRNVARSAEDVERREMQVGEHCLGCLDAGHARWAILEEAAVHDHRRRDARILGIQQRLDSAAAVARDRDRTRIYEPEVPAALPGVLLRAPSR